MGPNPYFTSEESNGARVLRLQSADGVNRLTRACVVALTGEIAALSRRPGPLVITGNSRFFSAGADVEEISTLTAPEARKFSVLGQALMHVVAAFPSPVYAAISGYCMGGGLDLALACDRRIASPHAVFGHRGAALGLITGWGGTQRLPRLVGRAHALQIFVAATKLPASDALRLGLVDAVAEDPLAFAITQLRPKNDAAL